MPTNTAGTRVSQKREVGSRSVFHQDHGWILRDRELRRSVHAYLTKLCEDFGCPATRVGGVEDHVHIACRLSRTIAVAALVKELKRLSSSWIKDKGSYVESFYWQKGYAAFSVDPKRLGNLLHYIDNQEEHHRNESFRDEYRRFLRANGIDFDEEYLWD